jgi:hypothetical protein
VRPSGRLLIGSPMRPAKSSRWRATLLAPRAAPDQSRDGPQPDYASGSGPVATVARLR